MELRSRRFDLFRAKVVGGHQGGSLGLLVADAAPRVFPRSPVSYRAIRQVRSDVAQLTGTRTPLKRSIPGMMEEMMPFSLSSYLLGVGTVVGALAFGFGGGVLLTKTAMKDSSPAESRVERVARAEPASPPAQTVEAKSIPTPPVEPRPPAASLPEVQANTEPPKPVAEAPKEAAPARTAESMSQTEPKKPAEPSTKPLEQSTKPADQKEAELRKAEERNKRFAERRARDIAAARARQRQFEEVRESSRPVFAYEREEPRSNLFEMPLFGRSRDTSPFDRDD